MIKTLRDAEIEIERLKDAVSRIKSGITEKTTVLDQTKTIVQQVGSAPSGGGTDWGLFRWDNPETYQLRLRGPAELDIGLVIFQAPNVGDFASRQVIIDALLRPSVGGIFYLGSSNAPWAGAYIGAWKIQGANLTPLGGNSNLGLGNEKIGAIYVFDAYIDNLHLGSPMSVQNGGTGFTSFAPSAVLVGGSGGGLQQIAGYTVNTGIATPKVTWTELQYKDHSGANQTMNVVTNVEVGGWQTLQFSSGVLTGVTSGYGL